MAAILSQYSTTGFYKAPVSKGILGCMFLTSCALNVPLWAHAKHYVVYTILDIYNKFEIWRVITSKATFLDTKDLVCGCLLIYYFRIFERRFGSLKFASYLLAACTVSTLLELTAVYALKQIDINITQLPTGPFGIVFPLFINYFLDIPRVAQTFIMGVPVTGKTLTYLLGLQMISASRESMLSGVCCLLAGIICRWNFFKVRDIIRFPSFMAKFADATLGWIMQSSPPQEGIVPMGATLEIQRQQQMEILEQQVWLSRARETRDRANHQRMHMAQGYAERLVPAAGMNQGSSFFGDLRNREAWENAFNLRRRNNQNNSNEPASGENESVNGNDVVTDSSIPEEQVRTLVEMGFDRQSVVRALRNSNNDINIATTILLNES